MLFCLSSLQLVTFFLSNMSGNLPEAQPCGSLGASLGRNWSSRGLLVSYSRTVAERVLDFRPITQRELDLSSL